ncbi:MAG: putative selenate ABC transporter substrate-binding protein [Rickettsiales bacterium]|nr:putative selenate ABC transporter substrate-binding protein [Rickettsiales bacterium]|tara:strand:- start:1591 stop:2439 length:849 start_codon:yes stop_codon:yes gene_type:complete
MFKINFVFVLLFSFVKTLQSNDSLIISSIPDESVTELHKKFLPLTEYLESEIKKKIEFVPVTSYASVVEALSQRKVDMAWLGGLTYIQAKIRSNGNVEPIIQRSKDSKFTSVFITHVDNKIYQFKDLKNKSFSFGSPSSTSGHLMPRLYLEKQNIDPEEFFEKIGYSGAHDATIFSVLSKKVSAGVLNSLVWEKFVRENPKKAKELNIFFVTPKYFDYNWTVRKDLTNEIKESITNAFLKLNYNNSTHRKILDLQRAKKYIKTHDQNYSDIFIAGKKTGLIK